MATDFDDVRSLERQLRSMGLSARAAALAWRFEDVSTIDALRARLWKTTPGQLFALGNVGHKTIEEVDEKLGPLARTAEGLDAEIAKTEASLEKFRKAAASCEDKLRTLRQKRSRF